MVGAFEISFYAKAVNTSAGTPQVQVATARTRQLVSSQTFTLTNDGQWHQYTFPFTGIDFTAGKTRKSGWTSG